MYTGGKYERVSLLESVYLRMYNEECITETVYRKVHTTVDEV